MRELRKKAGLSQYAVSKLLGISHQMVNYYEKKHEYERWAQIDTEKLCEALDCKPEDLFTIEP